MRHRKAGSKLSRTSAHRKALLSNLATALFERERILSTEAKIRALRPFAEGLITKAKRGDLHARRLVLRVIRRQDVVRKLFDDIALRCKDRPGGYTRIIKAMPRQGDRSEQAYLELVDRTPAAQPAASGTADQAS